MARARHDQECQNPNMHRATARLPACLFVFFQEGSSASQVKQDCIPKGGISKLMIVYVCLGRFGPPMSPSKIFDSQTPAFEGRFRVRRLAFLSWGLGGVRRLAVHKSDDQFMFAEALQSALGHPQKFRQHFPCF